MEVIYIIVGCLVFFAGKGIYDSYNNAKKLRARIIREYGSKADRKLDEGRAQSISYYCRNRDRSRCPVDDITWNDLDMDSIYYLLNNCKSAIGDEYLYYLLRNPSDSLSDLKERGRVIDVLAGNKELRTELGFLLAAIGGIKNISVYEYICRLKNVDIDSNLKHFLQAALLAASIGLIFYNPTIGIVATVCLFFANIISYFRRKSQIECYFSIFSYILQMAGTAGKLGKVTAADKSGELKAYTDVIHSASAKLARTTRGTQFFLNPGGSGDLLQTIFDYLRMAFHVDLIAFNLTVSKFFDRQEEFDALFENLGFLDCMLAAASYREWTGDTCEPDLRANGGEQKSRIEFEGLSHPLIPEPVVNSLSTARPVLLTGSNASGKSTFLKAVAINAILAQSIFTVRAEKYSSAFFHVMSSMALQDNLALSESYYIVEIKSLKRIMDATAEKDAVPVMCFIDEVLRGTNTVERIAASTEILKKLSAAAGMSFVATHDIELTYKLEEYYANYHFEEQVSDDEVTFDYLLHEGRTTTRNAIRLLGMLGFDKEIVDAAQKSAESMG
ncbi:MAG: hypothetical protein J6X17_08155 [Lachnospiraceae bacterium]|nr:hypothetical protein [Lachnospiraceae bacterium]